MQFYSHAYFIELAELLCVVSTSLKSGIDTLAKSNLECELCKIS